MRNSKVAIIMALCTGAVLLTAGCSTMPEQAPPPPPPAQVVVEYDSQALGSYRQARLFMEQGRYELARKQYLVALSLARNEDLRERLQHELQAADRMVRSMR